MGNNMLTLQEDNMDQFFQWDAEGTLVALLDVIRSH